MLIVAGQPVMKKSQILRSLGKFYKVRVPFLQPLLQKFKVKSLGVSFFLCSRIINLEKDLNGTQIHRTRRENCIRSIHITKHAINLLFNF